MNDNTCSICLDPLLGRGSDGSSKKIGTTNPCGHCFHTECFNAWQAASTGRRSCKCPNCNVKSKSFFTLFLSVGDDANAANDEDDDLSLSSNEEQDDHDDHDDHNEETDVGENENDNEDQQDERNEESGGAEPPNSQETITIDDILDHVDDDGDDDDDSVEVIDMTMSSPEPSLPAREATGETSNSSTTTNTNTVARRPAAATACTQSQQSNTTMTEGGGDQTERFKKIAKKYKRKFLQKQSQCQEQYKQHQELTSKMKDIQNSMEEKDGKVDYLQQQSNDYILQISNLQLVDVRRKNELQDKNRQVVKLTSDVQRVTSELTKLKKHYERDLSQAHSSSTAEVKELATRTKDLEQENARLRAALNQTRAATGRRDDPIDSLVKTKKKNNLSKKPPKKEDVAKALRGMDAVRTIPGSSSKRKKEDEPTYDTSRYSAQAARFVLAAAGQKKRKTGLSAAAADMLNPRHKQQQQPQKRPNLGGETSLTLKKSSQRRPLQRMNSHEPSLQQQQQTNGGEITSSLLTKSRRQPLQQRMNNDASSQTMTRKKGPPKMASIFQRR